MSGAGDGRYVGTIDPGVVGPLFGHGTRCRMTSLKLTMNVATTDSMFSMTARNPAFDSNLHDPADGPETYLAAVSLLHRTPYVRACAFSTGAMISMTHTVQASVCADPL